MDVEIFPIFHDAVSFRFSFAIPRDHCRKIARFYAGQPKRAGKSLNSTINQSMARTLSETLKNPTALLPQSEIQPRQSSWINHNINNITHGIRKRKII